MKNRLVKLIFLLIIVSSLVYFFRDDILPSTVRAFGDLHVNFHVPIGQPIFVVANMLPGDTKTKTIDVTNGGSIGRLVKIKGIRTGGVGSDPKLETVLSITIKDGATVLYGLGSPTGPKTVKDFFIDSMLPDGVQLNAIAPGGSKTYVVKVEFPSVSGNEFQKKSVIFDIKFGDIKTDHLVINEVYYNVKSSHGYNCLKDRGILSINGNNVTMYVQDTGRDSYSKKTFNQNAACELTESNHATVVHGTCVVRNKKDDRHDDRHYDDRDNHHNENCSNKLKKNDEWVELFNPTDHDISLKNWSLTDNFGTTTITANKTIKKGGFALLSKDDSTWSHWNENHNATIIELGSQIGDGLNDTGDHLILKNTGNTEVDRMSWGTDTTGFTPPATNPTVLPGHSTSRTTPGFDTDTRGDWIDKTNPNPGN